MPSKESHLAAAKENQQAIGYLCERIEEFPGWIVTIAFYKALHVVEALFAVDGAGNDGHTDNHSDRNGILKGTTRYQQIWRFYRPLYQASLVARYLREDADPPSHAIFSKWMPPDRVKKEALDHWLRQVESSAARLTDDNAFKSID